jgi:hypothetical protein
MFSQNLPCAHRDRGFSDTTRAGHVQRRWTLFLQHTKHFSGAILEPNRFDHRRLHSCQRSSLTGTCAVKRASPETRETPRPVVRVGEAIVATSDGPVELLVLQSFAIDTMMGHAVDGDRNADKSCLPVDIAAGCTREAARARRF